jgi:hypothetical protein
MRSKVFAYAATVPGFCASSSPTTVCSCQKRNQLTTRMTLRGLSSGLLATATVISLSACYLRAQTSSWEQLNSAGTALYESGEYPNAETRHRAAL